jgi:pSer/pThr/pTyr-binding forkhead associated (FHA) protein
MAKFTVFYNGECIKTYEMDEPVISIGRLPENAISIANMGVSRRHTKIEEDADRKYLISDLNSLNGTYVNGKRIKKTHLVHGDKITIGKYTIIYENLEQQPQIEENIAEQSDELLISPTVDDNAFLDQNIADQVAKFEQNEQSNYIEPMISEEMTASEEVKGSTDVALSHDSIQQKLGASEAVLIETNKHVVYKLDKAYLTMGNGENDDIFVSGFMIGEGQVSIEKNEDGYAICANKFIGKFKVNGKSAKTHLLKHKDRVEIGSSTFRYMENG